MANPTNIIHRRRAARNVVREAQREDAPTEDTSVEQPKEAKKSIWQRRKK